MEHTKWCMRMGIWKIPSVTAFPARSAKEVVWYRNDNESPKEDVGCTDIRSVDCATGYMDGARCLVRLCLLGQPCRRDVGVRSTDNVNEWVLKHNSTIAWYMDVADSSYIVVCYDCLWLIDHLRVLISLFYDGIVRVQRTETRTNAMLNGTMSAGERQCSCACFAPPGTYSAGRNLLIGCRASGGGSGGHTELARLIGAVDMPAGGIWIARAGQLVAALPVTGSLVCFSWLNVRNTTETVSFPRRRTLGDTDRANRAEFQVWLQAIAGDCNMDADSLVIDDREGHTFGMDLSVPWDAPEAMVDVSSAGVVPLRDLPDGMGLVGRQKDSTESRILQDRDPRSTSIRVLIITDTNKSR